MVSLSMITCWKFDCKLKYSDHQVLALPRPTCQISLRSCDRKVG